MIKSRYLLRTSERKKMYFLVIVLYLCSSVKQSCGHTTVNLGPNISKIFSKSSDNVRLDCVVEESSLSKWLINDTRVTFGTDFISNIPQAKMRLLSNYSLIIAQVNISDEGLYRCVHKDQLVSIYQLEVEVPPVRTMLMVDGKEDPTELWMRINDCANITCFARGAKPAVDIQWVINDIIRMPPTTITINEKDGRTFDSVSSLRFTMTENANVSCQFIQEPGYRQAKQVFIWKSAPSLSMVWQDKVITESFFSVAGEEYELSCLVHNTNVVNITWRINNTVMRSHDKDFVKDVGEMDNVTKSILMLKPECCNEINVSCIASQRLSLDDLQLTIVVSTIEKPAIYILDAKGNVVTHLLAVYGSEYNLTCIAVAGKPDNITWLIMDVPYWRAVTYNTTNQSRVNVAFSEYTYVSDGQRFHYDNFFHISCSTFDEMARREILYTINVTNIAIPNLSVSYNGKELPSVNHFDGEREHILVCKATGATPDVIVKWIVNNEQIPALNSTTVASRLHLGTYDTIALLTFKPKNDRDIITCCSEGKYAVQTVFLSIEVRELVPQGFLFRKHTLSLPVILTFLVLIVCIASIRKYLKSPSSSVENSHEYEYPSGRPTGDSNLSTSCTNIKETGQPPSFALPELPQEEPYNKSIEEISLTESEDVYYSRITYDSPESRVFSIDEVTLVTCLKKGAHLDRWMGVIRCSKSFEKSVVLSTKTDSPLYADGIHWPEYVKKVTELNETPFVVKVEGIYIISAKLYLVQEYVPMATLDKILSNKSSTNRCISLEHFYHALEVIHAVQFIHSFGFLHPGLSTKKILLSPDRQCKLYDFVLKEDAPSKIRFLKTREIWTLNDFPPESLFGNEYTEKSDVWLLAVLSWSLCLNGNQPFVPFAQKKSTSMDIYAFIPKKPNEFPMSLFAIFEDAWREDYLSRLSVKELKDVFRSEIMCFQKDSWEDECTKTNAQDHYIPKKGV